MVGTHKCRYLTKDHIEKIDFQEVIFAVVNWPNSELYRAFFVCRICYFGQSATIKLKHVFMVVGDGGLLKIFIHNTKCYGVKLGPMFYIYIIYIFYIFMKKYAKMTS